MPNFINSYYPLIIRENHLDTFGHVNNATYLQLFEEARWEFITARGYGLEMIQNSGLGSIVLEFNLKFLKELRLRQKIVIESQTVSYEKKIAVLRQNILDENNEVCCAGLMTFGLFDTKTRRLVLPTPQWLMAIGLSEGGSL